MQQISNDFQVKNGDIVQFDYKIMAIYEQPQINSIITKIDSDPRMSVVSYSVESSSWLNDILHIEVQVAQNPFPLLLLILAISAIGTSLFIYLTFDKAYLISREIPEVITGGLNTLNLGLIALIAGVAVYGLRMFKR